MRYVLIIIIILQIVAYSDYRTFKTEVLKNQKAQVTITAQLPPNLEELINEE